MSDDFEQRAIKFAEEYVAKHGDNGDDPIDDFIRIAILPAISQDKWKKDGLPRWTGNGGNGYKAMLQSMADYASQVLPEITSENWKLILGQVFVLKYGATKVYLKKKPAAAIKKAANNLTPNAIMTRFGVSRAYAYKIRAEAIKNRIKK